MDEKRQLIYSAISSHHFSNIMEKLYFQYKDGRNCDLEIRVTDGRIFAHKCLVDIFFTQAGADIDDDRFVLDLSELDENVVTALLDMMYTGELCIQPHLIKPLQRAAFQLGYSEAEKGCRIYLNSCKRSESESSDSPFPVTVVKEEPIDPDFQDNESSTMERNRGWPGGQEDLERLAEEYVRSFNTPSPLETSESNEILPCVSSVASSKNIYEVVRGKPQKNMKKLPDSILRKANELTDNCPRYTVDTAPAVQHRDPFLVVSRSKDGSVVLKEEKTIEKKGRATTEDVRKTASTKRKASKQSVGKAKTEAKALKNVISNAVKTKKSIDINKEVRKPVVKTEVSMQSVDCSTGTTYDSDEEQEDEFGDSSEEEEFGIYIDDAEQDSPRTTKSGRTSKRPSLYSESEGAAGLKRKRGRPRKNPLPEEMAMEDYARYITYQRERRNQLYEKRKKVVVEEKHYNNETFKLIAPAGSVPEGCRSRYGRPELMKTKFITETIHKGDGSVSVVTKEVPRRMTWHERQAERRDAKEPTFVICHPTAPVIRP